MVLDVLQSLFTPTNLAFLVGGVIIGIIFGAIPGLGANTAITLLLPVSFAMNATTAIIFMASIYCGGVSGGLISAILLGIPGTNANLATVYDGYAMAKKGQASKALGVGIFSSLISTFTSVLIAMLVCAPLARIAIKLGPWEYFSLCTAAIVLVVTISKGNMFSGLMAAGLGMAAGTVGMAPVDAAIRYTFGITNLRSGVDILAVCLGLFAVADLVHNFAKGDMQSPEIDTKGIKGIGISMKEYFSHGKMIATSYALGLAIGFRPGMGAGLSNVVAYAVAKAKSKTPEKFGTGCVEGVIAPEIANNASIGGAIIPMIALGIPGDTTCALLISALMIHGIEAGPLLMSSNTVLVYCFFGTLLLGALVTFACEWFGMRTFPYILRTPTHYLYSAIFIICIVGLYANSYSIFNCGMMVFLGALGLFMIYGNLPYAPFILGYILGPMMEKYLREGLTYSSNGFLIFLQRPVSAALLAVMAFSLFWPFIRERRELAKKKAGKETEVDRQMQRAEGFNMRDE